VRDFKSGPLKGKSQATVMLIMFAGIAAVSGVSYWLFW